MVKQFGRNGFLIGPNNDLLISMVSNAPENDNFRTNTLENPLYIGKATFIHMNAEILTHLGNRIVEKPAGFVYNSLNQDIMDLVPKI